LTPFYVAAALYRCSCLNLSVLRVFHPCQKYFSQITTVTTYPVKAKWINHPRQNSAFLSNQQHRSSTGQDNARGVVSPKYRCHDSSKNAEEENYNRN